MSDIDLSDVNKFGNRQLPGTGSSFLKGVSKALPYIGVALDILGAYRARKERRRAREAAYDANAIRTTLAPSDSGKNLPVIVGRVRTEGLFMFAHSGANVPWRPANVAPAARVNADGIGALDYYRSTEDGGSGGVLHVAPARGNSRDEFLLVQEYLARHDVHSIRGFALDGQNGWLLPAIAVLGVKGTASDLATRFAQGHGDNPGNLYVDRDANASFPLGSHVDIIMWQDVDGGSAFDRVPVREWMLNGALLPSVDGNGPYTLGTPSYSTSAARALLWLYTARWGFNVQSPSQTTLASIRAAQGRTDAVMQGRNGLWAQAYPTVFNTIEGTDYATYAEAFRARGYVSYSALTQARPEITDSADPGSETGWPEPAVGPNTEFDLIQDDWQTLTIKRSECNGIMFPTNNVRAMLNSVLQTMPFASFGRALKDGERVLVVPDLDGATTTYDITIDESEMRDFSVTPAQEPYDAVEVHFADSGSKGADATVRYPTSKREGVDTHASTYIGARHGGRNNVLVVRSDLIDNHFLAYAVAWWLFQAGKADTVRVVKHGRNNYADINDKARLLVPSRNVDLGFLVGSSSVSMQDGSQELVGMRIAPSMSAWPVFQRPDSRIEEDQSPRELPGIGPICATADGAIVTLDFDCERDDDGDIVPKAARFEDGCDAERRIENGSEVRVPLPVMGPGDASYAVTGTGSGITYDADEHELVVASSVAAATYPIGVTGTIGTTTATCTFNLVVVQGAVEFTADLEGELGAGPLVKKHGDEWRVFIGREDGPQFGVRVRVSDTDATTAKAVWSDPPSRVTFAGVASQTLTDDGDTLVGTYVRYHFGDEPFDGVMTCTVTVGGHTLVMRLIVSRNAPS